MNTKDIFNEIEEIGRLPIVPKILELIATTTGMRFVALAKVTADNWIALAVNDQLEFGVKPGDRLELFNTLCSEVREYEKPVIFDDVRQDPIYCSHPIPERFGFRSHISVPIIRGDNSFYGTLCAIDPEPNELKNEKTLSLFTFLAGLISDHMETMDLVKTSNKNFEDQVKISGTLEEIIHVRTADLKKHVRELARSNQELKEFSSIASHDLQEPLRKIQTYVSFITQNEKQNLSERASSYFERIQNATERMRSLITDLLAYSMVQNVTAEPEPVHLRTIVLEIADILSEEIREKNADLRIGELCETMGLLHQLRQLFQNLIGNSIKYASADRRPVIEVFSTTVFGKDESPILEPEERYCKISVVDNGIGFEQQYASRIFKVFERLHGKTDYSGTGIGLAIVKKIIENHKGYISVKSEPGVGSEFHVYLPKVS